MKKNKHNIWWIALAFVVLQAACKRNFEDINTDPNTSPNALPEQLLPAALINTMAANMTRNRTFNNELMQVTVNMGDSDGRVFRYDIPRTWGTYPWNSWYIQLTNFKDLHAAASREESYSPSFMAISLICQSWIYALLTDTYGDVPYSESNKGRDEVIYEPKFDRQQAIYMDIFERLEEANTLLTGADDVPAISDPVYGGVAVNWRRFGNSLYLRLLLRVSGNPEVTDFCAAKIQEILSTQATYPLINNNSASAVLRWTDSPPYISPYYNEVREQDWRQPAICEFFIDNLVNWNDPRLFSGRWAIATSLGAYAGVPSGYAPGNAPEKRSWFHSFESTTTGISLQTDPMMGNIMNYAEVQFIIAEAALRGWVSADAESHYNLGTLNAITYWLPDYDTPIEEFLSAADIQWDESESFDEKMERIHLQKYYALLFTDNQQWYEYRRTGHPTLPKGPGLRNNGVMPARLNYPDYVQSSNATRYREAVAAQGPDEITTEVWWQQR